MDEREKKEKKPLFYTPFEIRKLNDDEGKSE